MQIYDCAPAYTLCIENEKKKMLTISSYDKAASKKVQGERVIMNFYWS